MDDRERGACQLLARHVGRLPAWPPRIGKVFVGCAMNGVFEVAVILLLAGVATAQTNAVGVVDSFKPRGARLRTPGAARGLSRARSGRAGAARDGWR